MSKLSDEMIVFHHLPKTGGTSLINALREKIDRKSVLHYTPENDTFLPRNIVTDVKYRTPTRIRTLVQPLINHLGTPEKIGREVDRQQLAPEGIKLIEGHFFANQIGNLDLGREIVRIAIVRDPLERAVSQYDHFVRSRGVAAFISDEASHPEDINLEDYILHGDYTNLQTRMLEGRSDYHFGTTERLDLLVQSLGLAGVGIYNQGYNRTTTANLRADVVEAFIDANLEDYELYEHAREQELVIF